MGRRVSDRTAKLEETDGDAGAAETTYAEAIRRALRDAMAEDESVILLGQDTALGFPFGATRDLVERFGAERVIDTPISEAATMGCGIGAAVHGLRPVVEVDYAGFLLLAFDQLVNNAAKLRYMSNGQLRVPIVVRVGQGPLGAFAAQHSQSLQGWLANVPGLCVCTPATCQDAYETMRWSLRQGDPVVFNEDMRLYRSRGPLVEREPSGGTEARVVRPGRDATAIVFGYGVPRAHESAAVLAAEGIELEILDLRFLSPLDVPAIRRSIRRTGRVVCVSDDPLLGGFSATLATIATEQGAGFLESPVVRLGARHTPVAYDRELEKLTYPSSESLATAVRHLVAGGATA
jgi:pyruvate dehydrogenase E1 component beta subunit